MVIFKKTEIVECKVSLFEFIGYIRSKFNKKRQILFDMSLIKPHRVETLPRSAFIFR